MEVKLEEKTEKPAKAGEKVTVSAPVHHEVEVTPDPDVEVEKTTTVETTEKSPREERGGR